MHQRYTLQQEPEGMWSVLHAESGAPLRLAGIPQTRLTLVEAEVLLDLLAQRAGGPEASRSTTAGMATAA